MKVSSKIKPLIFVEGDDELRVSYGNRGGPFRDGVELVFNDRFGVSLDGREVVQLRNWLNEFLIEPEALHERGQKK